MKALVVMDSNLETLELCDELTRVGLYTQHAPSGLYALTMLERERPNLVVSGENLGDMSGQELLSIVREDLSMRDVAFILIAADAMEELDNNLLLPVGTPISEIVYRAELMLGLETGTPEEAVEAEPDVPPAPVLEAPPVAAPVIPAPTPVIAPPVAEVTPPPAPARKPFDPNQSTADYEHVKALLEMVQHEATAADALGATHPGDLALPFETAMATPSPVTDEPEFDPADLEIDVTQLGELVVEGVESPHSVTLEMELLDEDPSLDEPFVEATAVTTATTPTGDPWADAPVTGTFEFAGRGFIRMVESMASVTEHGRLHLRCGPDTGLLYFAGGRLIHVEFAGQRGEDGLRRAFLAASDHKGGSFGLETMPAEESAQIPVSVTKPINQILLTWSA